MHFDILSIFPEMFSGPLNESIIKRALQAGLISVGLHDIRAYATDKHHTTDDTPYGGGAGMVMKVEPLAAAIRAVIRGQGSGVRDQEVKLDQLSDPQPLTRDQGSGIRDQEVKLDQLSDPQPLTREQGAGSREQEVKLDQLSDPQPLTPDPLVILMTPAGEPFTQRVAEELAGYDRLVLVCGRYEGVDERVREALIDRELSIGDYVLTGGELAAMVVLDAVARLVPGVIDAESIAEESHSEGLLEYPHYTRPAVWEERAVPPVLLSGHHGQVALWRRQQQLRRTLERRPDLLARAVLSPVDRAYLRSLGWQEDQPEQPHPDL